MNWTRPARQAEHPDPGTEAPPVGAALSLQTTSITLSMNVLAASALIALP
jgi:hypothetical protein